MLSAGPATFFSPLMIKGFTLAFLTAGALVTKLLNRMSTDPTDHFWEVKPREYPTLLRDPTLGIHRFIQLKEVTLHYVEKGDRSRPLMLLIHGYPGFWYTWRQQIREFSNDYWVVAVDLRGFGQSEKPNGEENYRVEVLVQDIRQLVYALGKDKSIVVAHDIGGFLAWYYVLTYPQHVSCYVIMNSSHPYVFRELLDTNPLQIVKTDYVFFYQFPFLPEFNATVDDMALLDSILDIPKGDLEVYKYNFGQPGAFGYAINFYKANLMFETSPRLLGLGDSPNFPKGLLLFGADDKLLDLVQEPSAKMAANTRLEYIFGAGHFVMEDNSPSVNRLMRSFLNEFNFGYSYQSLKSSYYFPFRH